MTACARSSPDHRAAVDLNDQALELMAQIAHGRDARHARAALEGVQLALQLGDSLLVLAIAIPGGERGLSRLEQLGRLLAVDIRDLVIELLGSLPALALGRVAGLLRRPRVRDVAARAAAAAAAASGRGGSRSGSCGTIAEALVSLAACASCISSSVSSSCNRPSRAGCSEKNAVDSLMWETTLSMARTASANVASPVSDSPRPLSKTLRMK